MVIGDIVRLKFRARKDEHTGVEVTRLTDGVGNTTHPYFTQNLMDRKGGILLCVSDRTGWWQLYALDLLGRTMIQLTNDTDIRPHAPCLSYDGSTAYYWDGRVLKSVEIEDLEGRVLYMAPEGFNPTILSITRDGRYLAFAYSESAATSVSKGRIHSDMLEHLYLRPRSVVLRFDTVEERAEPIWGEREWISHINISPLNPDVVLFCHEGPWHLVQRMWIARASTHEVYPLLEQKRFLERAGHEFFTARGRVAVQFSRRGSVTSTDWARYDVFLNSDGSGVKMFRYRHGAPSHIQSRDDEKISVGDRAYPEPSFKDGKSFISIITYEGEEALVKPLCRHGTSWLTQHSHPHPVFTPDYKNAIFTSDSGGQCNIYRAPIDL